MRIAAWPAVAWIVLWAAAPASAAAQTAAGDGGPASWGSDLEALLSTYRWRDATWAVLVTSLETGDTLFAHHADTALAPASNMKLLTGAAALEVLGPSYRYRTYLLTRGDVRDGVLGGDLVLYGTGDPGISDRFYPRKTSVFRDLARQLRQRGIRVVRGDLVGDASYLPGPYRPAGWERRDLNEHFAAPVSALSYNENVVSFRVRAGARAGAPPFVETIPSPSALEVRNEALTVAGRARPRLAIVRDDPAEPVRIVGRIRAGSRDVWRQMTVSDPERFAVAALRQVLAEEGIEVTGGTRVVRRPGDSVLPAASVTAPARADGAPRVRILARHESDPLARYLEVVNKKSHNLYAELIYRTVGRVGHQGTGPFDPAAVVRRALEGLGVDVAGVRQVDGSGLSAANRVTAGTLVGVLQAMARSRHAAVFAATLPEAGRRRELARMFRTPAAGNLRAKTGTIDGASALSGMVQTREGERLVFSILVNGTPSTSRAKRVEDAIGARLASIDRGFAARQVAGTAQLPPPAPLDEPVDAGRHRVRRGETLSAIALRYGVTVDDLLRENPSVEPRRLRAGAWIRLPAGGR